MYTLIAFATEWGSKHGGINSFNADFLKQFGAAYHHGVQIICVVTQHTPEAVDEAAKAHVRLIALPYVPASRSFDSSIGALSVDLLGKAGVEFDPENTVWLGHDLITGEAANAAAKVGGGRSAVIHHMSYSDYESYAEDSESALRKTEKQTEILRQADLVLAIGPLLRDAAIDRSGANASVNMLVPGLPEIDPKEAPKTFVAFLSGRLSNDAARIKQGHLGVAAFAAAELKARNEGAPEPLRRQPKLLLRGVDFENRVSEVSLGGAHDPETELKQFAEKYAHAVINLHALSYTENREQLYSELSGASVALMPSWHEGFGLVAWEAIAAGVPLIIGENSGVYRLLEDELFGAQKGFVHPLDLRGQNQAPYFRPEDLEATVTALKSVAMNPANARNRASMLRNMLLEKYTWPNCCENAAMAFSWDLQRGSVRDRTAEIVHEITEYSSSTASSVSVDVGPLTIPHGQWRPGVGMADSQLLRAEEESLPFDMRRKPDVETLTAWGADTSWPITVQLITGEGGQGKTRLAIQVCQQLRAAGWHSGFLDSSLDANRISLLWRDLRCLNQPIFVVVDYAETRQEAFLALLKAALENLPEKPVRMLLLARNGGEWWDNVRSKNSACEGLLTGPATTGPFRLPPLYTVQQDRQEAFSKAMTAFAEILQVDKPAVVQELVGDQFQRPLFVQMAALLALYGERPTTIQGLTKALLNHERRYWVGLLASLNWPDPGRRAEQLLALATLAGGFATTKAAETTWNRAKGTALNTGEFNLMFRNLATLYPGAQGLQPLRPDLLGEALVAQALLRPDGDVLLDAVLSSSATHFVRRNALTVLARMSNERADVNETLVTVLSRRLENCAAELVAVSTETASPLPELAELAFNRLASAMKNQVAGLLRQSLPYQSVQLAGLSCVVFSHVAESARRKLQQKPNNLERMFDYVRALDQYGASLFHAGRYEPSLKASHEALLMMRKLVSRERSRYEASYGGCLLNYVTDLATRGKDEDAEDALTYANEALDIFERLKKQAPRFEPDYAISLAKYATSLSNVGRNKEALAPAEQAVEIFKKLVNENADSFEAEYAETLGIYAGRLSKVGEIENALEHLQKTVDIRERLKQRDPDRFEPDYAASLGNFAANLTAIGRMNEALDYAQKAYVISERLAEKQPQRFVGEFLNTFYFVRSLSWLCHQEISENEHPLEALLSSLPAHEQLLIQITKAFVQACVANNHETRAHEFRFVLSNWHSLSRQHKRGIATYRFCAAAWGDRFDALTDSDWQADWCNYVAGRNGNIPFWMGEVARRLDFEFPATDIPG